MINYLRGKVTYKNNKSLTLENQAIGFKVFCSPKSLKELPEGKEVKLFTYLYLKDEKTFELYGFLTREELELFESLKEISGIGPRTALDLSVFGSLEDLKKEMEKEGFYQRVRGIGKKKMQKILLELTGKIKEISKKEEVSKDEVLDALTSLGFPRKIAREALNQVSKEIEDSSKRIKEALRILGKA